MLYEIFMNLMITIALLFLSDHILKKAPSLTNKSIGMKLFGGTLAGILAILLMIYSIRPTETVVFDLRQMGIIIAALYGGFTSSLISGIIIAGFRILFFGINGTSVTAALIAIVVSIICGFISTRKKSKIIKYVWMNIVSIISFGAVIYLNINETHLAIKATLSFVFLSVIGGFLTYLITEYLIRNNLSYQQMEYYRIMADNLTDLVSTHDINGKTLYISPSCKAILKYEPEELLEKDPYTLFHQDDIPHIRLSHKALLSELPNLTETYKIRRKDGQYIWLETTARGICNKEGQVQQIITVSRDITFRKKTEEDILYYSQRNIDILESIQDAFLTVDKNWVFTYANKEAERLLQKKRTELLGNNMWNIFPDTIGTIFQKNYEIVMKTRHSIDFEAKHESLNKWFRVSVYSAKEGISIIFLDITKEKIAEKKLKEANEQLKKFSFIDALTDIANRRYFDEVIYKEWRRAVRKTTCLSLLVIDVDYFKLYNDTYGHQQGDQCLKMVAHALNETVNRSSDLVARYGGEEFAVILPETNEEQAEHVAEKIRQNVERLKIPNKSSKINQYVTISIGVVAMVPGSQTEVSHLIDRADKALYKAKENGRNQSVRFTEI